MEQNKPGKNGQTNKKPVQPRTNKEKEQVINRLKRIEGQVRGIQNMVENDRYCMDILIQLSAIQSALKKVGFSILERHTKTCVAHSIKNGDQDNLVDELLEVIQQYSR